MDGIVYSNEKMLKGNDFNNAINQVVNVAGLPGIVKYSIALPDIHLGYGFPIGGVAAFDPYKNGVISPGGVGYDINCGVRAVCTSLTFNEVKRFIQALADALAVLIPSGVGATGRIRLNSKDMQQVLLKGAGWPVKNGYGEQLDLDNSEENGCMSGADPETVSAHAKERGANQIGTLGSGNHFVEVQAVDEIFDEDTCRRWGIFLGQVIIMLHSGSRGLGHQVCTDYISLMQKAVNKHRIDLIDRQLCCAPIKSEEGARYFSAMAAAANYAWANRQILMHWVKEAFSKTFNKSCGQLGMHLLYDVSHNIAKMEAHEVDGKHKVLCVHRKGATRGFPDKPVLVPGDMGRYSFILKGAQKAMEETWGSVCHGAGRALSRHSAAAKVDISKLEKELNEKGIIVRAASRRGLAEEAPQAYKDAEDVVEIVETSNLAVKVARMRPLIVVKG